MHMVRGVDRLRREMREGMQEKKIVLTANADRQAVHCRKLVDGEVEGRLRYQPTPVRPESPDHLHHINNLLGLQRPTQGAARMSSFLHRKAATSGKCVLNTVMTPP